MASFITSILGGVQAASASKNAGNTLAGGYNTAGQKIDAATGQAIGYGNTGLNEIGQGVTNANNSLGAGMTNANNSLGVGMTNANNTLQGVYNTAQGNVQPYQAAGTQGINSLAQGLAPGGDLSQKFDASMMQSQDPGYAFRLQQGQQALERSAAARGGAFGGGELKALNTFSQGQASSEYNNAFNQFNTQQQNRYNMLNGLANQGQQADAQSIAAGNAYGSGVSNNTMNATDAASNNFMNANLAASQNTMTGAARQQQGNEWMGETGMKGAQESGADSIGAAQAHAQGIIGSANAWNGMLSGIGNAANSALMGGFGGGGGFNLGGAMSGMPQWGSGGGYSGGGYGAAGAPPVNGQYG